MRKLLFILFLLPIFSFAQVKMQMFGGIRVEPNDSIVLDTSYNEVSWLVQKDTAHLWDIYNRSGVLRSSNVLWRQVTTGWTIVMKEYANSYIELIDGIDMVIKGKDMMDMILRMDAKRNYLPASWIVRSPAMPRWDY